MDQASSSEELAHTHTRTRTRTLQGTTRVGDSIDDEWLIVWLLSSLSRRFPELVISIRDGDGEFLLIESANEIPKWVEPDNVENRFWLAGGKFWLIPLEVTSRSLAAAKGVEMAKGRGPREIPRDDSVMLEDDDDEDNGQDAENDWISEQDAVEVIRDSISSSSPSSPGRFWVGPAVQDVIDERIAIYPSELNKIHHHRTLAYLPAKVARALNQDPALVQRAAEAFYTRDPAQLRTATRSTIFSPSASSSSSSSGINPVVLTPVTLTRTAYAQLRGQRFLPPKQFPSEWRLPPLSSNATDQERELWEKESRWRDLGVKIIVGMEIMYKEDGKRWNVAKKSSSAGSGDQGGANVQVADADPTADPAYQSYIDNLKHAGFFGHEMDGSQAFKIREEEARRAWITLRQEAEEEEKSRASASRRTTFAESVDQAVTAGQDIPIETLSAPIDYFEDSEQWLQVAPQELDFLLQRASAAQQGTQTDDTMDDSARVLSEMAQKVEKFVKGQGDLQGAQFEDELSDDDDDEDLVGDEEDQEVLSTTMTAEEREARLRQLVPGLEPGEWGQKEPSTAEVEKKVSFADDDGTVANTTAKDKGKTPLRPPVLEPESYDGHVVDSDEDADSDADQDMATTSDWNIGGNTSKPMRKSKTQSNAPLDPNVTLLQESLKTGKAMPTATIKPMELGDSIEISDNEDDDEEEQEYENEVDMDGEQEEFINFAREALGIDDGTWEKLISERASRGAYVPPSKPTSSSRTKSTAKETPARSTEIPPVTATTSRPTPPQRNPNLDSFDKVMEAMEAELARAKKPQSPPKRTTHLDLTKLPKEEDLDNMDVDELEAMDRELRQALKSAGVDDEEDEEMAEAVDGLGENEQQEYKMMKDFLESYKSQGGQSGVVGNLLGRLGEQ